MGRNLKPILTPEGALLLMTNWGGNLENLDYTLAVNWCDSAAFNSDDDVDNKKDFDLRPLVAATPASLSLYLCPSASFQEQLLLPECSCVFSKRPLRSHVPQRCKEVEQLNVSVFFAVPSPASSLLVNQQAVWLTKEPEEPAWVRGNRG